MQVETPYLLTEGNLLQKGPGTRGQIGLAKTLGHWATHKQVICEVFALGAIGIKPALHALNVCQEVENI